MIAICSKCNLPTSDTATGLAMQLCKCMWQHPKLQPNELPTTEEEEQAWQDMEHKRIGEYLRRAQIEAEKFVDEYRTELPIMTLRKAFELGFRRGYTKGKGE